MKSILIGSLNSGKINEYREMLEPLGFHVLSLFDMEKPVEVEETGATFLENAFLKAKMMANTYQIPTIVDDSGLEVAALQGRPGIHSKRYSLTQTDTDNNLLLLKELENVDNRKARFVCQIVYYEPMVGYHSYEGIVEGEITRQIVMENGFGYDPVFYIPEINKTLSQLTVSEKNRYSHRGRALQKLLADLSNLS